MIYTWKSHVRCGQIVSKLDMMDTYDDEGVTQENFHESIVEAYFQLTVDDRENTDFKLPPFLDKLNLVCKHHLTL